MKNLSSRTYQWLILSGGIALVALIYFSPRMQFDARFEGYSADEASVTLALAYMNDEKGPMKGIKMLDRIAELNPNNRIAVKQLADFSLQTGQYAKAVERLEHLVSISSGDEKISALIGLSHAAEQNRDTTKAIQALEQIFEISNDSLLLQSSKERIDLLKK